jgi:putative DNA methylase
VDECKWPKDEKQVARDDIEQGRAPRPRVLDMFAGGGAIPLEAARLGCESHALELNPVAYLIELCTLTFPQQFGAGLADDVEHWARRVLERTQADVSEVLARIPRPGQRCRPSQKQLLGDEPEPTDSDDLSVVAYYWTRTAPCPNPQCQGTVPLYRQTWLRKKPSGYLALKPIPEHEHRVVRFQVVESTTEAGLGFDPGEGSEGSSTACPFPAVGAETGPAPLSSAQPIRRLGPQVQSYFTVGLVGLRGSTAVQERSAQPAPEGSSRGKPLNHQLPDW